MEKLPSEWQPQDIVTLNFFDSGTIKNCEIISVRFTASKVCYDVAVIVKHKTDTEEEIYTILTDVDATYITKEPKD